MALTLEQIAWLKIYNVAPTAVNNFYFNLINKMSPFTTKAETIGYDEVKKVVTKAKILARSEEFPIGKQNGFVKKSVTPDIIKDSIPFSATIALDPEMGQAYLGGNAIDNTEKKRNERINKLKNSIEDLKDKVSAEMFFNQTYTPENENPISFTKAIKETVTGTVVGRFSTWARKQELVYQKENKTTPSYRFIGSDIFEKLVDIAEAKNSPVILTSVGTEVMGNTEVTYIILAGRKYHVLPDGIDAKGNVLNPEGMFILYNQNAIIPAYVGLTNVQNGKATIEETDMIIRETSANEKTGDAETLAESGFIPILVNPKLIYQYKITGVADIK